MTPITDVNISFIVFHLGIGHSEILDVNLNEGNGKPGVYSCQDILWVTVNISLVSRP